MNCLHKGDEHIDFTPCCCGEIISINHRKGEENVLIQRVGVHLARLYYRKWKELGFTEKDESNVEDQRFECNKSQV